MRGQMLRNSASARTCERPGVHDLSQHSGCEQPACEQPRFAILGQRAGTMPAQRGSAGNKLARKAKTKNKKVAIYTRTSSKKSEVRLSTSKSRQVQSCLGVLKSLQGPGLKNVLKVSEVKSGRLPLSKRPAFKELVSGQKGALKVFVESARAIARDVWLLAAMWPDSKSQL